MKQEEKPALCNGSAKDEQRVNNGKTKERRRKTDRLPGPDFTLVYELNMPEMNTELPNFESVPSFSSCIDFLSEVPAFMTAPDVEGTGKNKGTE